MCSSDLRRGYAFISYAGPDKPAVCDRLVPALAANDVGFFDYRFTERLIEDRLQEEIERRIHQCAVVIVYSTLRWPGSPFTLLERRLALTMGKPIVAVLPALQAAPFELPVTTCAFGLEAAADREAIGKAIELATGRRFLRPVD